MKTAPESGCRISKAGAITPQGTPCFPWLRALLCLIVAGMLCAGGFLAGRQSGLHAHMATTMAAAEPSRPVEQANIQPPATIVLIQTNFVYSEPQAWNESRWAQLHAQPGTVARNATLAALLEKLAATDPRRALALAQAEGSRKLRDALTQATLHGWARTAPQDAANWANALTDASARDTAMSSVFAGAAAADPQAAVRVGNLLISQNPGAAGGYGTRLIDALSDAGNFAAAAQMAGSGDAGVQRSIWMAEAYSKWSELQPEQAAQAASAITDPAARNDALHGVVGGWAQTDPAGLTQFLVQLPPDAERGQMVGQALENWADTDPVAVADWMNNHAGDLGSDLDKGMQTIATMAEAKPDVAVAWAENITDQNLRSQALNDVLRNWLGSDPQAAKNYFNTTQNLLPGDRQQISEILAGLNL